VPYLLDSNVVIHVRDGDPDIRNRVAGLSGDVSISVISRVELEGGVVKDPSQTARRRARLDAFVSNVQVLTFDEPAVEAYRAIVEAAGYSRRKMLDRMLAAQAIVHGLTLVTLNGTDFRDIPGLDLEAW
jgi:tRNA(fMet)-specific endonuclease VapC